MEQTKVLQNCHNDDTGVIFEGEFNRKNLKTHRKPEPESKGKQFIEWKLQMTGKYVWGHTWGSQNGNT